MHTMNRRIRNSRTLRCALPALALALAACQSNDASAPLPPAPPPPSPRAVAFLDTLSERTFRWFWDTQNPTTHLDPGSLAHALVLQHRGRGLRAQRLSRSAPSAAM